MPSNPTLDEMRLALSQQNRVAVPNRPGRTMPADQAKLSYALTHGLAPMLYGAAKGTAASVPGLVGDVNELLRDYVTPRFPTSLQNVLALAPAPYTTEQYANALPKMLGDHTEEVGTKLGSNIGGVVIDPFAAVGLLKRAPAAGRALAETATNKILQGESLIPGVPAQFINPPIFHAVKPKGGNWAADNLDHAVGMLKRDIPAVDPTKPLTQTGGNYIRAEFPHVDEGYANYFRGTGQHGMHYAKDYWEWMAKNHPDEFKALESGKTPQSFINHWIDTKLKNYVRNDMATPTDPVRLMADEEVSHIQDIGENWTLFKDAKDNRLRSGMPKEGYAQTSKGKDWEARTDLAVAPMSVKEFNQSFPARAKTQGFDVLEQKNPEATVNQVYNSSMRDLGFDHLTDELENAIRPNSDLPMNLRLKPESLEKMTVPQAIERVSKINDWRAAQMEKATAESIKEFPPIKEYEDGFKWHELKMPDLIGEVPEGQRIIKTTDNAPWGNDAVVYRGVDQYGSSTTKNFQTEEEALKSFSKEKSKSELEKALKNEGKLMGHCVGGYCEDVISGQSRVFTLRDQKNKPHVTIEGTPGSRLPGSVPPEVAEKFAKESAQEADELGYAPNSPEWKNYYTGGNIQKADKWARDNSYDTVDITQIKGKSNGAVDDKYRERVRDFLNSQENIGKVWDLDNVDLVDTGNSRSVVRFLDENYGGDFGMVNSAELYNQVKSANPNMDRFIHASDLSELVNGVRGPTPEGYRDGGIVKMRDGGGAVKQTDTYNEWDDNSTPLPLSLDAMRYELAKKGSMPLRPDGSDVPYVASEVPSISVPVQPKEPPRPASSATNIVQALADKFGITAIPQSILSLASGLGSVPISSAYGVYKGVTSPNFGTQAGVEEGRQATERLQQAMTYEPTSQASKDINESLAKALEASKLPPYIGGIPRARPILTPNDVRVMGANAKRVAGEVRDLKTDFANAQSGIRRENAFGEPTLGVKAEAVASDIGDVMARRSAAGKSTVPYVSDFLPETNTYAVKPEKQISESVIKAKAEPTQELVNPNKRKFLGLGTMPVQQITAKELQNISPVEFLAERLLNSPVDRRGFLGNTGKALSSFTLKSLLPDLSMFSGGAKAPTPAELNVLQGYTNVIDFVEDAIDEGSFLPSIHSFASRSGELIDQLLNNPESFGFDSDVSKATLSKVAELITNHGFVRSGNTLLPAKVEPPSLTKIQDEYRDVLQSLRDEGLHSDLYTDKEVANEIRSNPEYFGLENSAKVEQIAQLIETYGRSIPENEILGKDKSIPEEFFNPKQITETPQFNFDAVAISNLKKPVKVYHASNVDPMISTAEQRLIPQSMSTNINSPNYVWGERGYSIEIPAGAKVGKLKNIEDLNLENTGLTRIDLGKALSKYATENDLDAVFIKNVQGTAGEGEWAIFNPDYIKSAKHYESGELVFKKSEKVPKVIEQKMLQGIYRGYAGENPASVQEGSVYASPQRAVGEYYANKRAGQTGEEPHLEMLMVDPFKGKEYGHATAGTGKNLPLVTKARELTPEEIKSSTKLYATGGLIQFFKSGGGVSFADNYDAMRYELLRNQ